MHVVSGCTDVHKRYQEFSNSTFSVVNPARSTQQRELCGRPSSCRLGHQTPTSLPCRRCCSLSPVQLLGVTMINVSGVPLDVEGLRDNWLGRALPGLTKEGAVR